MNNDEIDEIIMGQVLTAGNGQNPARQANNKFWNTKIKTSSSNQSSLWFRAQSCDFRLPINKARGSQKYNCWGPGKYVSSPTFNFLETKIKSPKIN